MEFGANIFGVGALADPAALADVARLAEDLGYHSVFVADHVVMPRTLASKYPYSRDGGFPYDPDRNWLDPLVALGDLAGRTTTIRIGTSITVLPMRHPIITAKQIATADHLSGGRVIFGVGVGWMAEEFTLLGASFRDRGRRMDEYLALVKSLWTEKSPTFTGRYFQLRDCAVTPKPVQKPHVPVWIGGDSPAALRRAASLGDGWHSAGTSLAELPGKLHRLGEALDAAGRDRRQFVVSAFPTDRFTIDVVRQFAAHGVDPYDVLALSSDDVVFMASPIGHITAVLLAARVPLMYGMTTVWQDVWNPEAAVELIARERCTFTFSAPPFLHGLVHASNANRHTLRAFRLFGCGGAPIPRELVHRAEDDHGFHVAACYGSSEALVVSATTPDVPRERRSGADGRVLPDVEARLVDPDTGEPKKRGEEGELQVRTAALFAGYYRDRDRTAAVVSTDRWYSTGGLCTLDDERSLNVVGRKKDMIIRGGANISAREIEELLFTHPRVASVACVAMPDPVLVERVCAFVVCEPGPPLTFDEMVAFLRDKRIAAWKLPERLEVRDAFPMTASGKIQKYLLREEIARLVGQTPLVR